MSLFTELKRRNVIRVAIAYIAGAWLLTEVSGTLFPVFGIPDWGIRFVVIVLALGFLPALIISWAYELTPEGLKREKDVVRDTSITHITAKRLDGITIGLIVVALTFIMADRMWLSPRLAIQPAPTTEVVTDNVLASEPEPQYPPNSIAVLPFVNMSSDPEQEYFSDGISEELLNLLANIPELRVISRSSSFTFKGEKIDIPTVANKLNVALVLEGSVRKAGNQVRITAQLIEARSDMHLWSETYDRELENIFVVQDEISAAIVGALKEHLGLAVEAIPRMKATASTSAHDAYLRGRHLVVQRTQVTIEGAIREFEKAVTLDPDYALAHAELAIATTFLALHGYLTVTEAVARAAPHAERATNLDPTLAEAHAATGYILRAQEKFEDALPHFKRAIQINPNYAIVNNVMGVIFTHYVGNFAEGFAAFEVAVRLDPLSISAIYNHSDSLIATNRLVEADRVLEKLATIAPSKYMMAHGRRISLGGKWANAVLGNLDALRFSPEMTGPRNNLSWLFTRLGLEKEAFNISEESLPGVLSLMGKHDDAIRIAKARSVEDPINLAARSYLGLVLAAAGDYAHARPILDEMSRKRSVMWFGAYTVAALVISRRASGEEDSIGELVAITKGNVRRARGAGIVTNGFLWYYDVDFNEGLADYLAGERQKGLRLLAKAVEKGSFISQKKAYLQALYDDPGFAPIRAMQEDRQARERVRFLAIVCTDNPYAAVWQPAEGTCEQFVAEGAN